MIVDNCLVVLIALVQLAVARCLVLLLHHLAVHLVVLFCGVLVLVVLHIPLLQHLRLLLLLLLLV